jgi:hypothetical protein
MRTPRERLNFIKFPWNIYQNDPHWVPPLIRERKAFFDPAKNPYYQHADVKLFAAFQDDEMVGTIAANVNHAHNEFYKDRVGFFGFFECLNDPEISSALFDTARDWLKKKGREVMRGPMNYSTNEECGLLVDGFDSAPVVLMTYNPPYYEALIEGYGFSKAMDLYAYTMEAHNPPDYLVQVADEVARNPDLKIRTVDFRRMEEEIQYLKKIYNSAWSRNWGFVPLTDTEFKHVAKQLKQIIDPDLVFIAEAKGEPVGLAINLPDYNIPLRHMNGRIFPTGWLKFIWYKRKIDFLRVYALGVLHTYHDIRLDALLYMETWKMSLKKGYKAGEMSWILENNKPMNRALQWMGARIYKIYRIYDKQI